VGTSVDWGVARTVAGRVAGDEPFAASYLSESLAPDLLRLTEQAETLVAEETGLVSAAGPARARVTDRMGWIDANFASFDRLSRPLLQRLDDESNGPGRMGRLLQPISNAVGPRVAGLEVGALLGWMSGRVIGQYDLLIIEDDRPEDQDWVYYVGPNVLNIEKRYGFPPAEFRLWIALHECTHRAQFTGVSWLRPYFLSQVEALLDAIDPDPGRFVDAARQIVVNKRAGKPSGLDAGISQLLAGPAQREVLDRLTGLMSLLEGHGDITMDRAGAGLIPNQPRFARVMGQRRSNASGPNKFIQRILGFEAKLAQYAEGEAFVKAVEASGGRELFDQVWVEADNLPTISEIRDPRQWIDRVGGSGS
jgi:coenzyme F420 biosynthesis associated uncharacterized protein